MGNITKSEKFSDNDRRVILACADELLHDSNGVIGVLEKRLLNAFSIGRARKCGITARVLKDTSPTSSEWQVRHLDIVRGKEIMRKLWAQATVD